MIATQAKETAVVVAIYFLLSFVIDLSGPTIVDKVMGALIFGVIYTVLGVAIKLFKNRKRGER